MLSHTIQLLCPTPDISTVTSDQAVSSIPNCGRDFSGEVIWPGNLDKSKSREILHDYNSNISPRKCHWGHGYIHVTQVYLHMNVNLH